MLVQLTSVQLSELYAYDAIDPIGSEREDLRSGLICATVANMAGKQLERNVVRTPIDYMPFSRPERKPQTVSEQIFVFRMLTAGSGQSKPGKKIKGK